MVGGSGGVGGDMRTRIRVLLGEKVGMVVRKVIYSVCFSMLVFVYFILCYFVLNDSIF